MIHNHRPIAALLVALVMVAASCSGSDEANENLVPIDAAAPGVVYVSTSAGDIQAVTPAGGEANVVVATGDNGQQSVVDIAPAPNADGVQALVRSSEQPFTTTVADVNTSGLTLIDGPSSNSLSCLDPHADASAAVAHETEPGTQNGAQFSPVTFGGGSLSDSGFELISVACPRWTSNRDTVATAIPMRNGDPSSIVTVVQGPDGERHEIGFNGCGTTPTSFSPDDQFMAVALTCYSASWASSGLYILPVDQLADLGDLSELTKVGNGLFGRTSWHPEGAWIAVVHADAIESQNIAQDLGAQPLGLQVIEVDTRQTINLPLADGASPFSIAWLETALS